MRRRTWQALLGAGLMAAALVACTTAPNFVVPGGGGSGVPEGGAVITQTDGTLSIRGKVSFRNQQGQSATPPAAGALVVLGAGSLVVGTDDQGNFQADGVPAGQDLPLKISAEGFLPDYETIPSGATSLPAGTLVVTVDTDPSNDPDFADEAFTVGLDGVVRLEGTVPEGAQVVACLQKGGSPDSFQGVSADSLPVEVSPPSGGRNPFKVTLPETLPTGVLITIVFTGAPSAGQGKTLWQEVITVPGTNRKVKETCGLKFKGHLGGPGWFEGDDVFGTVTFEDGTPVDGALVTVWDKDNPGNGTEDGRTSAKGELEEATAGIDVPGSPNSACVLVEKSQGGTGAGRTIVCKFVAERNKQTACITNSSSGTLAAFDAATMTMQGSPVSTGGSGPVGLAFGNNRYCVANFNSNNMSVLDDSLVSVTGSPFSTGGNGPLKVSYDAGRFVVTNLSSNAVSVFDAGDLAAGPTRAEVGTNPVGARLDARTRRLFVANSGSNDVTVLDASLNPVTGSPVATGGTSPQEVAIDVDNRRVYVSNFGSDDLTVLDADTLAPIAGSPFPTGGDGPAGVAVDRLRGRIYVAHSLSCDVAVLDASTLAPITGSPFPTGQQRCSQVAYDAVNDQVLVVNTLSNSVTVFHAATMAQITGSPFSTAGNSPQGIALTR